jgi:hypothetical protein
LQLAHEEKQAQRFNHVILGACLTEWKRIESMKRIPLDSSLRTRKMKLLLITSLAILLCSGCQRQSAKEQWDSEYEPTIPQIKERYDLTINYTDGDRIWHTFDDSESLQSFLNLHINSQKEISVKLDSSLTFESEVEPMLHMIIRCNYNNGLLEGKEAWAVFNS